MSDEPRAIVHEIDGQLVLEDPDALGVIEAVEAHNRRQGKKHCEETLRLNQDRVEHFANRIAELGLDDSDVVIVIINVDDVHGAPIADLLMPGFNWQEIRDRGEVPFARGLAGREGIQDVLTSFDESSAERLAWTKGAVVVIDHGVAEVWEYRET